MRLTLTLLLCTAGLLCAEEAADPPATDAGTGEAAAAPAPPPVKDLGGGRFSIGEILLDQKDRSITFPARVNMTEGLLEYALVHQNGKIHEALLVTDVSPFHLNVALKLLRYQASEELFPILDSDWKPTKEFPKVPEDVRTAARVEILLSWKKEDGTTDKASLNDWIYHTVLEAPIPATPWIYGGSYVHEGRFQAESSGDFAAIFTSNSALFNYPGKDRELDDVWVPTPKRIPPVDTPLTVTIKPALPAASKTESPE